jgi:3-isopropylmalate/(R)-2-methylmalate dehydratase small subunit
MGLKGLGIALVVADSVARETLAAHALQEGLAIMEAPGVSDITSTGDELSVDLATGAVRNTTTGKIVQGRAMPHVFLERLEAGGLVPYLRQRLKSSGSAEMKKGART